MTKRQLDFNDVRQLCASIAAKDEILVVVVKARKYSTLTIPFQRKKAATASSTTDVNVKTLEDILLNDLNIKGRDALMKRMSNILPALKTTDLDTAKSFLRLDRYSTVRENIVTQLNEFVSKDLKMTIASRKLDE